MTMRTSGFRRRSALLSGAILAATIGVAACDQAGSGALSPSPQASGSPASGSGAEAIDNHESVDGSLMPAGVRTSATAATVDNCTPSLNPRSRVVAGITSASFGISIRFPQAKEPNNCRWTFGLHQGPRILTHGGNNKTNGWSGRGNDDTIEFDVPASVRRSTTQTKFTVVKTFTLTVTNQANGAPVPFTLTTQRFCPESYWCNGHGQ